MDIPRDVFDCGDICLGGGLVGWPELFLICLMVGLVIYFQIRQSEIVSIIEHQLHSFVNKIRRHLSDR